MWVVLVHYLQFKETGVSQEGYRTLEEATEKMKSKAQQIGKFRFYDENSQIIYELKNIIIK